MFTVRPRKSRKHHETPEKTYKRGKTCKHQTQQWKNYKHTLRNFLSLKGASFAFFFCLGSWTFFLTSLSVWNAESRRKDSTSSSAFVCAVLRQPNKRSMVNSEMRSFPLCHGVNSSSATPELKSQQNLLAARIVIIFLNLVFMTSSYFISLPETRRNASSPVKTVQTWSCVHMLVDPKLLHRSNKHQQTTSTIKWQNLHLNCPYFSSTLQWAMI